MSSALIEYLALAGIALFIGWRLYITLGQDEGPPDGRTRSNETAPAAANMGESATSDMADVLPMRPNFTGPAAAGLESIHERDASFDPVTFMQGARSAYKMIVEAFARGDLDMLKPLLDTDVYETWSAAIKERQSQGTEAPSLLRLREADIVDASLDETSMARVFVEYKAELGDGESTYQAHEVWTFMRKVDSKDPNWILDDVDTVQR